MEGVTPPLPAVDDPAMRAVLRDGAVATLKIADAGDRGAIQRFFHDPSPESRRTRFFTFAEPSDDLIGPPVDLDSLRELLLRVSRLAADVPEIAELDLNFEMALSPGHGCRIVDARIKVRETK